MSVSHPSQKASKCMSEGDYFSPTVFWRLFQPAQRARMDFQYLLLREVVQGHGEHPIGDPAKLAIEVTLA
jgi:hypothetical protein